MAVLVVCDVHAFCTWLLQCALSVLHNFASLRSNAVDAWYTAPYNFFRQPYQVVAFLCRPVYSSANSLLIFPETVPVCGVMASFAGLMSGILVLYLLLKGSFYLCCAVAVSSKGPV